MEKLVTSAMENQFKQKFPPPKQKNWFEISKIVYNGFVVNKRIFDAPVFADWSSIDLKALVFLTLSVMRAIQYTSMHETLKFLGLMHRYGNCGTFRFWRLTKNSICLSKAELTSTM